MGVPSSPMAALSEQKLEEANRLAAIVKLAAGKPRAERAWIARKERMSLRKLDRKIAAFQIYGLAGLLRKKPAAGSRALPTEWTQTAARLFLEKRVPNFKKAHRAIIKECLLSGLEPPSYSWTRRWVKRSLPQATIDFKLSVKKHREDWRVKYEPCVLREKHDQIRDIVDGDWHKLDIEIVDDEGINGGKPYRPFLCAIGDCCSDEILGFHIQRFGNALGIGLALRHGIMPKRHPISSQIDPKVPTACAGKFNEFYTDQGKDFTGAYIQAVIHDLGGSTRECEGYHGQSKPIERWFGTLTRDLISELPGYIGHKKDERPWNAKPTLTRRELFLKIYEWTFYDYHNRETRALKDFSPYGALAQHVEAGFRPVIPDERTLDLLLMPTKRPVTIRKWGIELFGTSARRILYWSDAFASEQLIGQKAVCKYNPNDLGEVLVYVAGRFVGIARSDRRRGYREKDVKDLLHRRRLAKQAVEQTIKERMAVAQHPDELERIKAERVYAEMLQEERREIAAGASVPSIPVLIPKYQQAAKQLRKAPLREPQGPEGNRGASARSLRSLKSIEQGEDQPEAEAEHKPQSAEDRFQERLRRRVEDEDEPRSAEDRFQERLRQHTEDEDK